MKNSDIELGLIGFGSIGKQVKQLLLQDGFKEENLFIFDDKSDSLIAENYFSFWDFLKPTFCDLRFLPTIGYLSRKIRAEVIYKLEASDLGTFSYVHSTSYINSTATIGKGTIIYPMCNIGNNVDIGKGVIINNSCTISHGSIIRDCVYLSPGAVLSGDVEIGENSFIGSGSVFSNDVKVGRDCCVGIATCVNKNIPDGSFAIGNPIQFKTHINI